MKAMIIESFGGAEKLKFKEVPVPVPQEHEVLIQIACTAVNPVDWKIREGMLKSRLPHKFPIIPGWDASGKIEKVGENVRNFHEGDEVYAYCRKPTVQEGTYAEYVTCDAKNVALKPKNITYAQAAAIPLVGLTAWQALFDSAHLKSGQKILIHAGSGGVGSFAIQFAKFAKAEVFTTCSASNHDYVKRLGADHAIDYTKENFADVFRKENQKFDVILDTVGGKTLQESYPLVKSNGVLVSIVEVPSHEMEVKHHIRTDFVFVRPDGHQLAEIAKLVEQKKVIPPDIREMNLKEAALAQEQNKQGHTRGKIVLKVSNL
jgi:NADPH2:quinone reductase